MNGLADGGLGGFHDTFTQRGVGVNGESDVHGFRIHFNGQGTF